MSNNVIIGSWQVTPDQNKLSLNNEDFVIEPLAMAVLVYFAKNPNKVISLDELVEEIWKGRVVGDHAIYRIINQIRKILGRDDGVSYIKTIRKKGYQLNQPVSWPEPEPIVNSGSSDQESRVLRGSVKRRWNSLFLFAIPLCAIAAWFGLKYINTVISRNAMTPFDVLKPYSVLIGKEKDPSFSPDGKLVSYSHQPKSSQFFKLFVQAGVGESPMQITHGPGNDFSASWSPDGTSLVFIRHLNGACSILRVQASSTKSTLEKVADCKASELPNEVIWGRKDSIYFTDAASPVDPYKIYRYSLKTSKKEQLTNPESGKSKGDIHMALSNREDRVAFARDLNWGSTQVNILDLETREITPLFKLPGWRKALAWSFDDRFLYYIDENDHIYAYSVEHGYHKKVFENDQLIHSISGHKSQDKVAIMLGDTGIDIWASDIGTADSESAYIESSEIDLYPEFANTSADIAFVSLRSGQSQIWVKSADGREFQLSNFADNRIVQRIRWSPDDKYVLGSRGNELYVINRDNRDYRTVWECEKPCLVEGASWSLDGEDIYFSSDIDGDWQIYRIAFSSSNEPTQVTENGGYAPELRSGDEMLYFKYHQDGIWTMNLSTRAETQLVQDTNVFAYDSLYARNNGFFYIAVGDDGNQLSFFDWSRRRSDPIQPVTNPLIDVSVSRDSSMILYPKVFEEETEIRILEKTSN